MKKIIIITCLFIVGLMAACTTTPKTPTLDFASKNLTVQVGEDFTLTPLITNLEGDDLVNYVIGDATILSRVDTTFSPLKAGSTTITATLKAYPDISVVVNVTVLGESYTITYNLNGGTQTGAPTTFEEADLPLTLPTPSRSGYTLDGWYETSDFTGTAVTTIASGTQQNKVFYAKWIENSYTITYVLNGGEVTDAVSSFGPSTVPLDLPIPSKQGSIFLGWYRTSDFSDTMVIELTNVDYSDQTFYAKWEESLDPTEYTIAYTLNGGTQASAPTSYTQAQLPIALPTPSRSGYIFAGWFESATFAGNYKTEIAEFTAGNKVYYARWLEQVTYSITYQLDGGSNDTTNPTSYTIFDLPFTLEEPTKAGHTFLGWYENVRFTGNQIAYIDYAKQRTLYARWEGTVETTAVDILVNSALVDTTAGSEVVYNDVTYVFGTTAFATLATGIANATGRIYVVGTFNENVTINKSNLTFLGPNAFIDPNTGTRGDEAILQGTMTIATGTNNITFNGLAFTGSAKIVGNGVINQVRFVYNKVYDTTAATATWIEAAGYTSGFFAFASAVNNELKNFTITNNQFDHVSDVNLNFIRITNVLIDANTFTNFDRDAIRFDTGGFNQGELTFTNNVFANDTLGGYNGIYFRIYGGDELMPTMILIENNQFKNIGQTTLTSYSGAISMRNFQEKVTTILIQFNEFETCANYIHIRNNATALNHANNPWDAKVNYNIFKGIPTTYYYKNWTGADTEVTNPSIVDFQFNYYEDNAGNPIADLSTVADKFFQANNRGDNYPTFEAYETMMRERLTGQIDLYVNGAWDTKALNEVFDYEGVELTYGVNAFGTIASALTAATAGMRIYILPGTYADNLLINKNNITLMSPNMNVDPNVELRGPEATISGLVQLAHNVEFVTINGLGFTGSSYVTSLGDVKDFTFIYNYFFNTAIGSGDTGLVYLMVNNTSITAQQHYRLTFLNNRFQATGSPRLINICQVEDLIIKDNYFTTGGGDYSDAIRVWHLSSTMPVVIQSNTFFNLKQYSIFFSVNYRATEVQIVDNIFDTVMGGISMRAYNGTATVEDRVIVGIEYNTFKNISGVSIRVDHAGTEATSVHDITVRYNIFSDAITTHYFSNSSTGTAAKLSYNYFSEGTPTATKLVGISSNTDNYTNLEDVPKMTTSEVVMPTSVTINNPTSSMQELDTYQLEVSVGPSNSTLKKVSYSSSNTRVATVSASGLITAKQTGTTVIRVVSDANPDLFDSFVLTVTEYGRIEVTYEGPGAIEIGEELQLDATIYSSESEAIVWASSNTAIATVDASGIVTGVTSGTVLITATVTGTTYETRVGITVYGSEVTDDLLKYMISINNGVLFTKEIWYIGSDDGSADYLNRIYNSVSAYYGGTYTVTRNMLPTDRSNYSNVVMSSIESITVHDTAGSGTTSTAQANSNWCTSISNTATSWHYTIGNDGVFQQLENNIKGFHAGDGSRSFELVDTGIVATNPNPVVTISPLGYYVFDDVESTMLAPIAAQITASGIYVTVGQNGNYWMNLSYYNSTYRVIANQGGNNNSIGIETAVNNGSDVILTWHRTARMAASLAVQYDLGRDRILYHNSFSGKPCPRTMMTAGLTPVFDKMADAEYHILKNFSEYTITFTSNDPTIIDNTGRVISRPMATTNVTYTVTVSKTGFTQSIVLNVLVPGQYNW